MEHDLDEQATRLNTREELQHVETDEFIESLEEQSHIKHPQLSIGNRQSLSTCITWLESLKESVRGKFVYGGRIWTPLARHWKTAFESRILMSAMINFKHIEPRRFLKDVSKIVLEHVHCVMQRYDYKNEHCFQWHEMFVWIRVSPNKSIAIWNFKVFQCTDLREWYVSRIVESILTSLEEFQERDSGWAMSRYLMSPI